MAQAALPSGDLQLFAVSSSLFWEERWPEVLSFFAHLRHDGVPAFLVGRSAKVCEGAGSHGITCVLGRTYSEADDPMGMMERWAFIRQAVAQGRAVAYAGIDVRFFRPVASLFRAVRASVQVDAAFEGSMTTDGRVVSFTPDVVVAFPTARTLAFVSAVLEGMNATAFSGLPPVLHHPGLATSHYQRYLMGPAQQDLLLDTLLSTLHGRPIALRKTLVASNVICCHFAGEGVGGPKCRCHMHRRLGLLSLDHRAEIRAHRRLGQLPVQTTPAGAVVTTAGLTALMFQGRMTVAAFNPCGYCHRFKPGVAHAIHCLGKNPKCLDLTQCACVNGSLPSNLTA